MPISNYKRSLDLKQLICRSNSCDLF